MAPVGCGCDMLHRAESENDQAAEVLRRDGPIAQERWRCPCRTEQAPDPSALDDRCREVLKATERLTHTTGLRTCPNWYPRLPWVHEAVSARAWRDKGALRERVGYPSIGLVRAIDLVDRGDGARQMDDIRRREDQRKAEQEERERAAREGR